MKAAFQSIAFFITSLFVFSACNKSNEVVPDKGATAKANNAKISADGVERRVHITKITPTTFNATLNTWFDMEFIVENYSSSMSFEVIARLNNNTTWSAPFSGTIGSITPISGTSAAIVSMNTLVVPMGGQNPNIGYAYNRPQMELKVNVKMGTNVVGTSAPAASRLTMYPCAAAGGLLPTLTHYYSKAAGSSLNLLNLDWSMMITSPCTLPNTILNVEMKQGASWVKIIDYNVTTGTLNVLVSPSVVSFQTPPGSGNASCIINKINSSALNPGNNYSFRLTINGAINNWFDVVTTVPTSGTGCQSVQSTTMYYKTYPTNVFGQKRFLINFADSQLDFSYWSVERWNSSTGTWVSLGVTNGNFFYKPNMPLGTHSIRIKPLNPSALFANTAYIFTATI
ncbi:MAG: hypothetical protein U0X91_21435 [Spirosomataceae bacterium]